MKHFNVVELRYAAIALISTFGVAICQRPSAMSTTTTTSTRYPVQLGWVTQPPKVNVRDPLPPFILVSWHEPFDLQCSSELATEIVWTWKAFHNDSAVVPVYHGRVARSRDNPNLNFLPMKNYAMMAGVTEYRVYCTAGNHYGSQKSRTTVLYIQEPSGLPTVEDITPFNAGKSINLIWTVGTLLSNPTSCSASFTGALNFTKDLLMQPVETGLVIQSIDGLHPSMLYTVTIECVNSVGNSLKSEPFTFITNNSPTPGATPTFPTPSGNWRIVVISLFIVASLVAIGFIIHIRYKVLRRCARKPVNVDHSIASDTGGNQSAENQVEVPLLRKNNLYSAHCSRAAVTTAPMMSPPHTVSEQTRMKLGGVKCDIKQVTLKEILGEGEFGRIYKGLFRPSTEKHEAVEVALKTISRHENEHNEYEEFVKEGLRMKDMDHPNVMKLIGICLPAETNTNFHNSNPDMKISELEAILPLVIVPYMPKGGLKHYLSNARINNQTDEIGLNQLLQFAYDISSGMEYLAARHIVHRNLACRNCLIDGNMNIVVSGFGFSRRSYSDNSLIQNKWMAPECLSGEMHTAMSDVWSFGVTAWELFTFCQTPYAGHENHDMLETLQAGTRLEQPVECPRNVWNDAIAPCWDWMPEKRPLSTQISAMFAGFKTFCHHDDLWSISESDTSVTSGKSPSSLQVPRENVKRPASPCATPAVHLPTGKIVPKRRRMGKKL